MSLRTASATILGQIIAVTGQLDETAYSLPVPMLHGNTIGKHVRHIIEFYECLVNGSSTGKLNYDLRTRDLVLETSPRHAMLVLQAITQKLTHCKDQPMQLEACFDPEAGIVVTQTSFNRELAYNIEHAIHHMAIIRIAIENQFSEVIIPGNFGVAYSTIRYQQQTCAR